MTKKKKNESGSEAEWWKEDAARVNEMAQLAQNKGFVIRVLPDDNSLGEADSHENREAAEMAEQEFIEYHGHKFRNFRAVCITVIPPTERPTFEIDSSLEDSITKLVAHLGPSCRVNRMQWIVKTDEPADAIWQDLHGVAKCNLLVFAFLPDANFKFSCLPESERDEWDFDGIAAFFQGNPSFK